MSYITDIYKFTRELNNYIKENDKLPKENEFNRLFAEKHFNGNIRQVGKIAQGAMSDQYKLVGKDYDYYELELRGYNIVKGMPYLRLGLVNLWIAEYDKSLGAVSKFLLSGIFWGLILGLYKFLF